MNLHKRALSLLLSLALVFSIFGLDTVGAYAAQSNSTPAILYLDSGDIVITDSGYSVNGGSITQYFGNYLITQNGNGKVQHTITVQSGTPDITIDNINIDVSTMENTCAFSIAKDAAVNLTLEGTNTLKSGENIAGLQVPGDGSDPPVFANNASLTVTAQSTGSLTVTGGYESAGIGGNNGNTCGTVEISGGTVTATGGFDGAGIGGGGNGKGGNITINSGNVTAIGDGAGAGIGGGYRNGAGKIFIHGGLITATGGGGNGGGGAGIGSGGWGSKGKVMIDGGTVTAIGKNGGAGIGGGQWVCGYGGGGCDVSITGSDTQVKAQGSGGYDIGSGSGCSIGGSLTVSGGAAVAMLNTDPNLNTNAVNPDTQSAPPKYRNCQIVTCNTEKKYDGSGNVSSTRPVLYLDDGDIMITDTGATVGGSIVQRGPQDSGYLITQKNSGTIQHSITVHSSTQDITLCDVHAKPIHNSAFEVESGAEADITLVGSNSLDTSGSSSLRAGLAVNDTNTVHISGSGSLTATGKVGSAGIGGNYLCSCGTVEISGGTVTANGCLGGAGIGGGQNCAGGDITISGGTVTATGNYGAGIGGGSCGAGGDVTICGSNTEVTAKGQNGGRDIGSGDNNSNGGNLTVGDSNTAEPLPVLKLLSAGTNAANPGTSRPQFMNCVILGAGTKDASGKDISGCYDKNGKLWLDITMQTPSAVKVGESLALSASVKRHYFNDTVTLPGTVQFTGSGKLLGSSTVTNGAAQMNWTPTSGNEVWLKAVYIPAANDRYAQTESIPFDYTPGKTTPVVSENPTASTVTAGSPLSASKFSGGKAVVNGAEVLGKFQWVDPNTVVTGSKGYPAFFAPDDSADYNNTSNIMIPVTVTAESPSADSFSPTLPSSLTDVAAGVQAELSGAAFPSYVTSISLSVTKPAQGDRQAADFSTSLLAGPSTGVINIPELCNISLLDQNGNPVSFTGTVRVKIPLPACVRGTPRVFRCEPDTKKFTDMNATVANGYFVFSTDHLGDYAVAGVGNAIVLDTLNYQMPVNGQYQIGLRLPGTKAASVKYYSTNDKVAAVIRLKNGNYQVIGKGTGTAYIMFDVYDNKNHLLTHASVRIEVKTGIRPRGDSTRQFGIF